MYWFSDHMSVEEVHNAVEAAAERARKGEGPTLLEFRTYRSLRKYQARHAGYARTQQ